MDQKINLALVGFGKFGKKYYRNIQDNKNFSLKTIFRKNVNRKNFRPFNSKNLNFYKYDAGIVCTPVQSHYKVAKLLTKNKIPIILEKPAAETLNQIKKLTQLSNKKKTSVIVNHSDLYNKNFEFLYKKRKDIGKIQFIEANFGKYSKSYKDKSFLPYKDWLPHPLALIFQFIKEIHSIDIKINKIYKKKEAFFQILEITFKGSNKINGKIFFSNTRKKRRNLKVYGKNGLLSYDGYNQINNFMISKKKKTHVRIKNIAPMQNILQKLYNVSKKNKFHSDLNLSLKIQKFLTKIKLN